MIDRIRKFKPPIGVCSTDTGSEYSSFSLGHGRISQSSPDGYECEAPNQLFFRPGSGRNEGPEAFCYVSKTEFCIGGRGGTTCNVEYHGKSTPIIRNYFIDIEIDPNTPVAFASGRMRLTVPGL